MNALAPQPDFNYAAMRLNMIEGQLRPNGINNGHLLDAMEFLPREDFVPVECRGICCLDDEIGLGDGRFMVRPLVQARLIQFAEIKPTDRVLDIGCGTGYSTTLIANFAAEVVALEQEARLARATEANIHTLGVSKAMVVEGVLTKGYSKQKPYNAIIINGAIEVLADALADQLAEGGRLVTVVRESAVESFSYTSRLVVYKKLNGTLFANPSFDAVASVLPGFAKPVQFQF